MKKIISEFITVLVILTLLLTNIMILLPNVTSFDILQTDVYKSDTADLWWSGANSGNIDGSGYIVPPGAATWGNSKYCWEHSTWNSYLTPSDRKAQLFSAPAADWIWGPVVGAENKITLASSYTGEMVFFKKKIDIPPLAFDISANLFLITADNAYYFYVNDDWSGTPDGIAGFMAGFNPANFYYTSDGINNLGGGTNSIAYEIIGNVYPKDASISTDTGEWSSIELYDVSSLLHTGVNWLQIVAINEHAPPALPENNPAGLIYKVVVEYKLPMEISIEKQVKDSTTGDWVDAIRVPIGTSLDFRTIITNTGSFVLTNLHVLDELSVQLEYRDNANYIETSVSPDLRTIIWDFPQLGIGETLTITYKAEAVKECYGSNTACVTTQENVVSKDLAKVKVHTIGQPVMGIKKSIWDETTNSWKENSTALLGKEVSFQLLITSTSLTALDVSIVDTLPDCLKFSNDATVTPLRYSSQQIEWNLDQVQPGDVKEIVYHATAISEGLDDSVISLSTSDNNHDDDSVLVNIVDPPSIDLRYPQGGETLGGTVAITWQSSDAKDPSLDSTSIYYRNEIEELWHLLIDLHDGSSEYVWDTTSLQNGNYQLQVVAEDTDKLYGDDTSGLFVIYNTGAPANPPRIPDTPSGETSIKKGTEASYTSQSTDLDSQAIYYLWDWGDNSSSDWRGPFTSGQMVSAKHIWNQAGTCQIRVKVKDDTGLVSDWSDPLSVGITKDKPTLKTVCIQLFEKIINRFIFLSPVIQLILNLISSLAQ